MIQPAKPDVCIENIDGTVGLTYGATLVDELAICYAYPGNSTTCTAGDVPWLEIEPLLGTVPGYGNQEINAIDAKNKNKRVYSFFNFFHGFLAIL